MCGVIGVRSGEGVWFGLLDDFMKCKYLYLAYLHMVLGIFGLWPVLVVGKGGKF